MSKTKTSLLVVDVTPNEELPTLHNQVARKLIGISLPTWNKHLKELGYFQKGRSQSKKLTASQIWDLLATYLWGQIPELRGQRKVAIARMVALIQAEKSTGKSFVAPALAKYGINFEQEKQNVIEKWKRKRFGYAQQCSDSGRN